MAAVVSGVSVAERAGKYLTFELGSEVYGLPVLRVREVIGIQVAAKVPHAPMHVKGVINLRGKVIPIVDLRMKFGLPTAEETDRTCIIVMQLSGRGTTILVGAVVDRVSEVTSLAAADIEDTPDFGDGSTLPYVLGIAKTRDGVRILIDPDCLFDVCELGNFPSGHGMSAPGHDAPGHNQGSDPS